MDEWNLSGLHWQNVGECKELLTTGLLLHVEVAIVLLTIPLLREKTLTGLQFRLLWRKKIPTLILTLMLTLMPITQQPGF